MSTYERYLQDKAQFLNDQLAQIDCDHLCARIRPSSFENGYRNRAKFKIFSLAERPVLRGTDPQKGEVDAHKMLWILPDWGRDIVIRSFELISLYYSKFPVDGFEIQLTHGNQKAHLTLSVSRIHRQTYEELAQKLLAEIKALAGIAVPSQKQVFGETELYHELLGEVFQAHYSAFFQSNLGLTPELLREVKTILSNRLFSGICDLYCGVGLFSLSVGKTSAPILGIDSQRRSIESATHNALQRGFSKAEYTCKDVQEYFSEAEIMSDDLLIFDPPRSGCPAHVLEQAASSEFSLCLMVSCSLQTQVRDIALLQKRGFKVVSLAAFDMFPFTKYLETVALLLRK